MSMPFLVQKSFQIRCVDEVSIVGKADSVRVVGEKWLVRVLESAYSLWNVLQDMGRLGNEADNLCPGPQPIFCEARLAI